MKTAIDLGLISAKDVIDTLGGTAVVAGILNIKNPSVSDWKTKGRIPDDKLIRLSFVLELKTDGRISRNFLFPEDWEKIWPELADVAETADARKNEMRV